MQVVTVEPSGLTNDHSKKIRLLLVYTPVLLGSRFDIPDWRSQMLALVLYKFLA